MTVFRLACCAVALGVVLAWWLIGLLMPPLTLLGLM